MLEYDRIDFSESTDITNITTIRVIVCHYW